MNIFDKYGFNTCCMAFLLIELFVPSYCEYSKDEVKAIEKLRNAVNGDLYQDYMKKDSYLLPWLKARGMNVERAADMLKTSIKWRQENRIDSLIEEGEELKCDTYYHVYTDAITKNGEPILQITLGEWDVRKQMIAGRSEQFFRCAMRFIEIMQAKIRKIQENEATGNITQFYFIADLKGYNLRQHACIACFPAYLNAMTQFEANYPQAISKFFLLNAPGFFDALLTIMKQVMSESTRNSIIVYGLEQGKWKPALQQEVAADQLTPYYGGTKKMNSSG